MRKPRGFLNAVAQNYQRKATMKATREIYKFMWGEEPQIYKKKKKKDEKPIYYDEVEENPFL